MLPIAIHSEIGRLESVIVHTPGAEVEKMTPANAQRALYSDILNLSVANREYQQFKQILSLFCKTYEVRDLLNQTLELTEARSTLLKKLGLKESNPFLLDEMNHLSNLELSHKLIEGLELKRDSLTRFLGE